MIERQGTDLTPKIIKWNMTWHVPPNTAKISAGAGTNDTITLWIVAPSKVLGTMTVINSRNRTNNGNIKRII